MKNDIGTIYNRIPATQAQSGSVISPCVLVSYYRPTMTEDEYTLVKRLINDLRLGGIDARPDEVRDAVATARLLPALPDSWWILLVQTADNEHFALLEERLAALPETLEAQQSARVLRVCVAPECAQPKRADLIQPLTFDAWADYPRALAGIVLALQPDQPGTFYGVMPGAAPPPPPQIGYSRKRLLGIGAIALIILLILGLLVASLFASMLNGRTTNPAHATPAKTATPGSSLSSSSPQQMLYAQVTGKTPAIDDSLQAQDANNWSTRTTAPRTCAFQSDGAYHVKAMRPPGQNAFVRTLCLEKATTFTDLAMQVDMKLLQGSTGGIVFRAQGQATYYWFSLDSHGCYELAFSPTTGDSKILSPKKHNCLALDMQNAIQLTVIAQGTTFYLYINGQFVYHIDDTHLTGPGQFGMIAIDRPTNPAASTEVAFTNMKIWTL